MENKTKTKKSNWRKGQKQFKFCFHLLQSLVYKPKKLLCKQTWNPNQNKRKTKEKQRGQIKELKGRKHSKPCFYHYQHPQHLVYKQDKNSKKKTGKIIFKI